MGLARCGLEWCGWGYMQRRRWTFFLFKSRKFVVHMCSKQVHRMDTLPYNLHLSYTALPYPWPFRVRHHDNNRIRCRPVINFRGQRLPQILMVNTRTPACSYGWINLSKNFCSSNVCLPWDLFIPLDLVINQISYFVVSRQFLCAFAKLRNATISFVMSVCLQGTTQLPLDGFW